MSDVNKLDDCMVSFDLRAGRTARMPDQHTINVWGYSDNLCMGCLSNFKTNTFLKSVTGFHYDGTINYNRVYLIVTYDPKYADKVASMFGKNLYVHIDNTDTIKLIPDGSTVMWDGGKYQAEYESNSEILMTFERILGRTVPFCLNWK